MPPAFLLLAIAFIVCVVIICGSLLGCSRGASPSVLPDATIEQIIRENSTTAVDQSIRIVAASLARHKVFVPIDDDDTDTASPRKTTTLRMKTGEDAQGEIWAYAYTSREEFSRAFPAGGRFAEMAFRGFFDMIERDDQFRGIYLNAGSDSLYPIPRELFEDVRRALPQADTGADLD